MILARLKQALATLAKGMRAFMPACRQVTRLQSRALDQPVPFASRVGMILHLSVCRWCRRYGRQIRFLGKAAREHPAELVNSVPQILSEDARQRMKQKLRGREP